MRIHFGADDVRREAQEEAALHIEQMEPVARCYPSAGACSEQGSITRGHTLMALQWLQIHGDALGQRWQ